MANRLQTNQPNGARMLPSRDDVENKPYQFQAYPSTRYHPDGRVVTVKDEAEDLELGGLWASTPYPEKPKVAPAVEPSRSELKSELADTIAKNELMAVDMVTLQSENELLALQNLKMSGELVKLRTVPSKTELKRQAAGRRAAEVEAVEPEPEAAPADEAL